MSPSDNSVVNHGADNILHPKIPDILPRERVFPIQVGGEVFKLSGASLSSDGTLTIALCRPQSILTSHHSAIILLSILPVPARAGRGKGRGSVNSRPYTQH